MKNPRNPADGSRTGMKHRLSTTAAALLLSAAAFQANATVTLTTSGATAPSAGANGISQTDGSTVLPYWLSSDQRSQGQSFTLGGLNTDVFNLNSFSLLSGASADGTNHDKNSAAYATAFEVGTWNIQIARFDNVNSGGLGERTDGPTHSADYLANTTGVSTTSAAGSTKQVFLGIANIGAGNGYTLGDWVTFSFTGADAVQLLGGYTYAVNFGQVPVGGYAATADFVGSANNDPVPGGIAFNTYGGNAFNDNYVHDLANTGVDRAFVANITAAAAPEPSSVALLGGMSLLGLMRRRRA